MHICGVFLANGWILVLFFCVNFLEFWLIFLKNRFKIVKNTKNKNAQKVNKYSNKAPLAANVTSTF